MKKIMIVSFLVLVLFTLTACQEERTQITINFDTAQGESIDPINISSDTDYELPNAYKEDHIFVGWYLTKKGPDIVLENQTFDSDNVTLYARYIEVDTLPYASYLNENNPTIEIHVRDYGT
ncbi:MAG: InlB B-repeat-containing protein, partial [Candidatus Izemoplasmataceae bacterium]